MGPFLIALLLLGVGYLASYEFRSYTALGVVALAILLVETDRTTVWWWGVTLFTASLFLVSFYLQHGVDEINRTTPKRELAADWTGRLAAWLATSYYAVRAFSDLMHNTYTIKGWHLMVAIVLVMCLFVALIQRRRAQRRSSTPAKRTVVTPRPHTGS